MASSTFRWVRVGGLGVRRLIRNTAARVRAAPRARGARRVRRPRVWDPGGSARAPPSVGGGGIVPGGVGAPAIGKASREELRWSRRRHEGPRVLSGPDVVQCATSLPLPADQPAIETLD